MTLTKEQLLSAYKTDDTPLAEESLKSANGEKWYPHFNSEYAAQVSLYTAKDDNCIRIVPAKASDETPNLIMSSFVKARKYFINGQSMLCTATFGGSENECPLVRAWWKVWNAKDKEGIRTFRSAIKYYCWIEDWNDVKDLAKDKPILKLYEMPETLYREIAERSVNRITKQEINVTHPLTGRIVGFRKKGDGLNTEYFGVDILPEDSPLQDLYENRPDFTDLLVIPTQVTAQEHANSYFENKQAEETK